MLDALPNGHAPLSVTEPVVTVIQHGQQTTVTYNVPQQQALLLLFNGLMAVHQQIVLAQHGQQSLVTPATPATLNGLLKG